MSDGVKVNCVCDGCGVRFRGLLDGSDVLLDADGMYIRTDKRVLITLVDTMLDGHACTEDKYSAKIADVREVALRDLDATMRAAQRRKDDRAKGQSSLFG